MGYVAHLSIEGVCWFYPNEGIYLAAAKAKYQLPVEEQEKEDEFLWILKIQICVRKSVFKLGIPSHVCKKSII